MFLLDLKKMKLRALRFPRHKIRLGKIHTNEFVEPLVAFEPILKNR